MRNYWLKIAAGALAVFAVGMVIVTGIRRGRDHVKAIANSTDPISIPVGFIPFKIDDIELGTLSRLTILRETPKKMAALNLMVKLRDSIGIDRIPTCVLVTTHQQNLDHGATFVCTAAKDTAGQDLAALGAVSFDGTTEARPLFIPRSELSEWQGQLPSFEDSANARAEAQADSITSASEAMSDSISDAVEAHVDSARATAEKLRAAAQARGHFLRDSIRAAHRRP